MAGIGFLAGAVTALIVGKIAIEIGRRLGVVDLADSDLKRHSGAPVPLGGAAVLLGAHVGLAIAGVFEIGLLVATLMIWVMGLADDIKGLNPLVRLLGATGAGIVLVVLSDRVFESSVAVFWVVAVVVVVNAINLLDGLDALAGSVATVAVLGITWFGVAQGVANPWILAAIAGALLGFLFWNRPPARLFLGDNGAYVVGLLLVWAAMWASPDRMAGVVAVGLVGVPLIDLGVTVFRRGLSGSPFFSGDRDHTYDRLHQRGFTEQGIAFIYGVSQALWVITIVTVSLFSGDLPTAITALALGFGIVGLLGVRLTLSQP